MQPDVAWADPVVVAPLCRGTPSQCADTVRCQRTEQPVLFIPIYPWTHTDRAREELLDALVRTLTCPAERDADGSLGRRWREALRPAVQAAYPGSPATLADVAAPPSKLNAEPWQLADDRETYGDQAGHWVVVDGSWHLDLSDAAVPTEEDAQVIADRINAEDPNAEQYRHWFTLNVPEGKHLLSGTTYAGGEAP